MSQIAYLEAIVGADITSFRRGMAEVRSEITQTTGLGESLQGIGTALTLGLTVPIVGIGFAATKAFTSFDEGMRNINSIMQLSEDQLKQLSDNVLDLGSSTRKGATAAAEALYTIVSAGFGVNDTAEAMKLLNVSVRTAEAGLADQNTTAQVLAQSLLAYGQNADSASHYADVLSQTVALGVGSMDDVAHSMGQAINIASLAKVSFDDLNGSAAFLTQRGMSFANAYTSLNQIISQLIKPTKGLTAAYEQLGVSSGTELISKFGGLGGALQALAGVSGNSADALAKLFTNVRALRGAASILGNFDQYTDLMNQFGESVDGVMGKQWTQQSKSFQAQLDRTGSEINAFLTKLGDALHTVLKPVIDAIAEFATTLGELDSQTVENIVKIGLLVAAIGPLVWIIGTLLSPLGLVVGLIALLAKAWSDNFLGIRDAVEAALPNIQRGLERFVAEIQLIAFQAGYYFSAITSAFQLYIGEDLTALLHDVLVGNWQKASFDLQQIWIDLGRLFDEKLATPLRNALIDLGNKIGWQELQKDFTNLGLGIAIFGTILAGFVAANLVGNLTTALIALLTTALSPLGVALIVGGVLLLAYTNNWLGFRDIVQTIPKFIDDITSSSGRALKPLAAMAVALGTITGGVAGGQKVLDMINAKIYADNNNNINSAGNPTTTAPGGGIPGEIWPSGVAPTIRPPLPATGGQHGGYTGSMSYSDIAKASGYGSSSTVNHIQITTNDPQVMLEQLRRAGVDIGRYQRS